MDLTNTNPHDPIRTNSLRDVIAEKIDTRWHEWAESHPHLARVVDRTRLIESTIERLQEEPAFVDAMRQSDLDEDKLVAAAKLLSQADRLIRLVLPL